MEDLKTITLVEDYQAKGKFERQSLEELAAELSIDVDDIYKEIILG